MFSKISLLPHTWRDKNVLQNLPTTIHVEGYKCSPKDFGEHFYPSTCVVVGRFWRTFLSLHMCGSREILENIFIPPLVW
jgi:hypothetical protein